MRIKPLSDEGATFFAVFVGVLCFGAFFTIAFMFSQDQWHHKIEATKHTKHWRTEPAVVTNVVPNISGDGANAATFTYYDLKGIKHTASAGVPRRIKVNEPVFARVSDQGKIYIPIANNQNTDDPYKAYPDGMYPVGFTMLVAVLANLLACFFIVIVIHDVLHAGFTIGYRRNESIYGMKTIPRPTRTKLVHQADGSLVEKEYRV